MHAAMPKPRGRHWFNDLLQRHEPQLIVAPKLKTYAVDSLAELPGVHGISVMGRQ